MNYDEICNKYIELSQTISALHTQIRAAKDAYELNPSFNNLAALNTAINNLTAANTQRTELKRLLQQRHC